MKRKISVLALCAMLVALCSSAQAQQPTKVPRIGLLGGSGSAESARTEVFRQGLSELGYVERKNIVIVRSDADLVLFDPKIRKQIRNEDLHQGTDHTIFEGWEVQGFPKMTLSRGKVLVEDGVWVGPDSDGQWLARQIDPAIIQGPAV